MHLTHCPLHPIFLVHSLQNLNSNNPLVLPPLHHLSAPSCLHTDYSLTDHYDLPLIHIHYALSPTSTILIWRYLCSCVWLQKHLNSQWMTLLPEKNQSNQKGQRERENQNNLLPQIKLLKAFKQTELQISKGISLPSQTGVLLKGQ